MYTNEECAQLRQYYLSRGEIFLGTIDDEHINQVILDIIDMAERHNSLTIAISSPGGYTSAGFRLAQFIEQELNIPVKARVWGSCSSASTYPLLCCNERVAHPEATFVLHRQTSSIETEYNLNFDKKVHEWKCDNKKIHKRQVRFYTRKLKLSKEEVEKELLRGTGIDAEMSVKKAQRIGLITSVSEF